MVSEPINEFFFWVLHAFFDKQRQFCFIADFPIKCLNGKYSNEIVVMRHFENIRGCRDKSVILYWTSFIVDWWKFCENFQKFLTLFARLYDKPLYVLKFFPTEQERMNQRMWRSREMQNTKVINRMLWLNEQL